MIILIGIVVAIAAYLIGSINPSIIISKTLAGSDIRTSGSGNAGATNMLRTYGKKMAIATLLLDVLKGVIAVLIARLLDELFLCHIATTDAFSTHIVGSLPYIAGFFVALGHNFPVFFGFRGGKGVATGLGVLLSLNWQIGIICLVIAISIMAISRYVSLGSVIGAGLFPILLLAFSLGSGEIDVFSLFFAIGLAALIIARHHSNIKRLIHGEENKLFAKKN
ncbi:MAG: glycerol-3-phosphate 1-O-acyltransferase PlsY [Clostridia bacterium]|nr:glycerol-3-phosphate 1-O-acyltransferase PlsY [Clostridia bacterium]